MENIHYITPQLPLFAFFGRRSIVGIQELKYVDGTLESILCYDNPLSPFELYNETDSDEIDKLVGVFYCSYLDAHRKTCINGQTLEQIAKDNIGDEYPEEITKEVAMYKKFLSAMWVPHFENKAAALNYVRYNQR